MAWVAVDKYNDAYIFSIKPTRDEANEIWNVKKPYMLVAIPRKYVKKLIGRDLTWKDDPVQLE